MTMKRMWFVAIALIAGARCAPDKPGKSEVGSWKSELPDSWEDGSWKSELPDTREVGTQNPELVDRANEPNLADESDESDQPILLLPSCGGKTHEWRPVEQVGGLLEIEEDVLSGLTPELLDQIMIEIEHPELTPVPCGVRNFRFRYVTQDRGELVQATAVMGVPFGVDTSQPFPIGLWLHGTTGFMDDCAPSAGMEGAAQTSVMTSQCFVSVAPDYVGMLGFGEPSPPGAIHPYLVGEATAVASWDSVRAALAALEQLDMGVEADPMRTVLIGGSQGGHAVFFADLYAPYYAPEFGVVAAAAAVPPTDMVGQAAFAVSSFGPPSFGLMALLTAQRAWYGIPDNMLGVLTNSEPYYVATQLPLLMSQTCHPVGDYSDMDTLPELFAQDFLDKASAGEWDALPPWGCFVSEASVRHTSVKRISDTPFIATYSEFDELVNTQVERESVKALCDSGYRIEYLECQGKSHSAGGIAALPYVFGWLDDRLQGKPWSQDKICDVLPPVDCEGL